MATPAGMAAKTSTRRTQNLPSQEVLSAWRRNGLFSRPSQTDQAQVSIEMGQPFNFDSEVEGLQGQVGKLKTVRSLSLTTTIMPGEENSSRWLQLDI